VQKSTNVFDILSCPNEIFVCTLSFMVKNEWSRELDLSVKTLLHLISEND